MNKEQLIKTIKETEYSFYAIRGWDKGLEIGEVLPESVEWDYEYDRPTENEIGGTCTTITDSQYSDFKDYYEADENEAILAEATVLMEL